MNYNKSKKYLYLFILFLTNSTFAQVDTAWTKQFNLGDYDRGIDVLETVDSSYMLIGYSRLNTLRESILLKTDLDGNTKWIKKFSKSEYGEFNHIVESKDSNLYVVSNAYNICKLYKFDLEGNVIWSLLLNNFTGRDTILLGMEDDTTFYTTNIILSEDNGVTLLAVYGSAEPKLIIAQVNQNGEYDWANMIKTNFWFDQNLVYFLKSSEGFFIAANEEAGSGALSFLRTDNIGNLLDEKFYRSSGIPSQSFKSMCYIDIEKPDSGYILTGEQIGDLALLRVDAEGNVWWTKTYPRYTPYMNFGNTVINSPQGGWIIIGGTGDSEQPKSFILQTDREGNLQWDNVYNNSYGQSIKYTSDNGYIACGTKSNKDIWLLKLESSPIAIISGDSLWKDNDWDGYANGTLNASLSNSPNGFAITNYEWSLNDSIIGTQNSIELNLSTGLTKVKLKVTDESGVSGIKVYPVQVCSYKLATDGAITSAISTLNDSIFYASSTDDQIYCFNNENNLQWTLQTGGDIQSTTTIGPDNNIYVGSADTRLYKFENNGNFKWDIPVGGVIVASPAITQTGLIYVGTSTNRLYSINSDDGSINWNYLTGGSISSSASVAKNGNIYFGSADTYLYSLNPNGGLNWKFKTNGEINSSPAIDNNGRIYFGSNDGKMYVLSEAGEVEWSYQTGGSIYSSPVIDEEGNSYIGSRDGYFYALNNNGNLLWKYNAEVEIFGSPSIGFKGDLIFGCEDGKAISLSKSGELNWYFKANSSFKSSPLITKKGRIYIGSTDKNIYGFYDPTYENYNSETITNAFWPTFQKNNQRTGSIFDPSTNVENINNFELPTKFKLSQNFPNPFNPTTRIEFQLPETSKLEFNIFNITGEKIRTIKSEIKNAGYYAVNWNGLNDQKEEVSSGIYIFQIKAISKKNTFMQSIKMIKLK